MSDVEKQTRGGMRRSLKVLLAVSLGLNMLVIGMIGGMMFHGGPLTSAMSARMASYGPFTRALTPKDRAFIGREMRKELADANRNQPRSADIFSDLKTALVADAYDSNKVHEMLEELQSTGLMRYRIGQRLLRERLDQMSPQERRAFAKRLERRHR